MPRFRVRSVAPDGSLLGEQYHMDACAARFAARTLARGGTLPPGAHVDVQQDVNGAWRTVNVLTAGVRKRLARHSALR